jgi:hypothetical protein
MKFTPIEYAEYFDLTKWNINEVSIFETNAGDACFISPLNKAHIYKGFKLTDNPLVNIYCELGFYKSRNTNKYIPRPTFIKRKVTGEVDARDPAKVKIEIKDSADAENFWKLVGFLNKFKDLVDVGNFESKFTVVAKEAYVVEFKSQSTAEKIKDLQELLESANLTQLDIQLVLKENRKRTLTNFKRLLSDQTCHQVYRDQFNIREKGEEAIWHHFLSQNHWLLGLNADIRFIRDFITEADLGIRSTAGTGSPVADFLGLNDFTILIELKTPRTKIFTQSKSETARTNTWSFSSPFIDGVSQCLAQRSDWEKKSSEKMLVKNKEVLDKTRYRTLDPKVIFIIGFKNEEFSETSTNVDDIIKRDTFENFRRNNRNLDILTFDELYERANYLVTNTKEIY